MRARVRTRIERPSPSQGSDVNDDFLGRRCGLRAPPPPTTHPILCRAIIYFFSIVVSVIVMRAARCAILISPLVSQSFYRLKGHGDTHTGEGEKREYTGAP